MNEEKRIEIERIVDDLVNIINAYEGKSALFSCQGSGMDGYSALANFVDVAKRARLLRSASNTILTKGEFP